MILAMLLAGAAPQNAEALPPSKAEKAADAFSLDLPKADPPSSDEAAAMPTRPSAATTARTTKHGNHPAAGAPPAILSLDTPIKDLLADPRGRAVLDADMEGLSTDANLARFETMSLRQFQAHTGGQLTDALLQKIATDFADPDPIMTAMARRKAAATGR